MTTTRALVLIPARMAATRLPGKPLLDIAGLPMIVHVLRRAEAAQIGRVPVATDPWGDGPRYHHIGLYAYRRAVLKRFVALPPSTLERQEKLEQLRALEAGMRIDITIVDIVPRGVDTPADLETTRQILKPGSD